MPRYSTDDDPAIVREREMISALRDHAKACARLSSTGAAVRKPRTSGPRHRRDPQAAIAAAEKIAPPTSIAVARAERVLRKLGVKP